MYVETAPPELLTLNCNRSPALTNTLAALVHGPEAVVQASALSTPFTCKVTVKLPLP